MGEDTLFLTGSQWVFQFTAGDKSRFIAGDNVAFGSREANHLVVKVDAGITVNAPTNVKHRVLLVDQGGYIDVQVVPERFPIPKGLLQKVLAKAGR
jgi:hypothetical protein